MRVLLATYAVSMGGLETIVRLLADKLLEMGHDADVFAYSSTGYEDLFGDFPRKRLIFNEERNLLSLLCSKDYDVIHAATWAAEPRFFRSLAAARFKGGVVVTCHGSYRPAPEHSKADIITAVAEAIAARVQPHVTKPVRVVYNAIDTQMFHAVRCDRPPRPVVLWVGRADDLNKDFAGFVAIIGRLADSGIDALVLSADKDERAVSVREWLPGMVTVRRHVGRAELPAIYSAAGASGGALVSTSISEGMALCVLEAMACKCPVVAPDVGGLSEVVEDGKTGVLYSRSDGARAVADRILGLVRDESLRATLTDNALALIRERHTVDAMAQGYLALYEEAAQKKTPFSSMDRVRRVFMPRLSTAQQVLEARIRSIVKR